MEALPVTDVYFPEGQPDMALAYPGPRPVAGDPHLTALALALGQAGASQPRDAFSVRVQVPGHESALFRGQRAHTVGGSIVAYRRLAAQPPALESLHLPKTIVSLLTHAQLCSGGLVLICGGPGQGKTTTLAATVAARLRLYGGLCVAVEDPPEIPLEGRHDGGLCMQIEVHPGYPLESAIHTAMRLYPVNVPSLLLVGEVRTKAAADEALCAALNGTLVCMTLHASSQTEALHRLASLAGGETALASLAASVRLVLHQRLVGKKMQVSPLALPVRDSEALRGSIRAGRFEMLASALQEQKRAVEASREIPL